MNTHAIHAVGNRRKHSGFSLIEVLVAVFVLSIGLLGAAALQVTAKRSNLEALQRATATVLVQEIVERMRANTDQLGFYSAAGVGRTLTGATMTDQDCSVSCTNAALAQHDLFQWEQSLAGATEQSGGNNVGGLISPTACITGPNGGSGEYVVALAWRGRTRLSNPLLNACGQGSGLYDSIDGAQLDVHRRLLVITTYIGQRI